MASQTKQLGLISRITDWLGSLVAREPADHELSIFKHHDLDELEVRLQIALLAEQAAAVNQPSSNATLPDGNEDRIRHWVESQSVTARDKASRRIRNLGTETAQRTFDPDIEKLLATERHFEEQMSSHRAQEQETLQELRASVKAAAASMERFKRDHHLAREPNYSAHRFLHVAILLVLLLFETIANGYFFGKGSEYGLVGGVTQAFLIAAINLAMGFLIGRFWLPNMNHRSNGLRLFGYCALPIAVLWIPMYNLMVFHYREQLGQTVDFLGTAGADALSAFQANPLALTEFDSWLLFLMGVVFAVVAFLDGYLFDDPYPGYGAVARRLATAKDIYYEEKQELYSKFAELRDQALSQLEESKQTLQSKRYILDDISNLQMRAADEYRNYCEHLKSIGKALTKKYRSINRVNRSNPPPQFFETEMVFTLDETLPELIEESSIASTRRGLSEAETRVESIAAAVHRTYTDALSQSEAFLTQLER